MTTKEIITENQSEVKEECFYFIKFSDGAKVLNLTKGIVRYV